MRGWVEKSEVTPVELALKMKQIGICDVIYTDIGRDGMQTGPNVEATRKLIEQTGMNIIGSGGVGQLSDLYALRDRGLRGRDCGQSALQRQFHTGGSLKTGGLNRMDAIKVIPCLDIQNGRVVKGIHFKDMKDAGDPIECIERYCAEGADEIWLLDISASTGGRKTNLDMVKAAAAHCTVPLCVGGGIKSLDDADAVMAAGASQAGRRLRRAPQRRGCAPRKLQIRRERNHGAGGCIQERAGRIRGHGCRAKAFRQTVETLDPAA